jgi:hypothetical protein
VSPYELKEVRERERFERIDKAGFYKHQQQQSATSGGGAMLNIQQMMS